MLVFECDQRIHPVPLGAERGGTTITVGRGPDATLRIDDDGLSRMHAQFVAAGDGVVHLMDLESTNGVFVNGERTSLCLLRPRDELLLGPNVRGRLRYPRAPEHDPARVLTKRQLEVACLTARGLSSPEIATSLGLSARTVSSHLDQVYRRLQLRGRIELARLLVGEGLV